MHGLTASQMVALPWNWQGPGRKPKRDEHGNEWFEIRIKGLDDFFVASETAEGAIAEAGPALTAYLESYLSEGEAPPLPEGFAVETIDDFKDVGIKVLPELQVA